VQWSHRFFNLWDREPYQCRDWATKLSPLLGYQLTSREECVLQMFANIYLGGSKDFLSSGLCDFFYRALELAQGDYSASSLITQQLLGPSALKEAVQSRLELAIQTVILNVQRQLSVLDLYQTMELPYTSPAYSPQIVSNDATSPNPPR
jgi:hypothetical protein